MNIKLTYWQKLATNMQQAFVDALKEAQQLLQNVENAQLEAEILLAHVLQKSRSYLLTWPEKILTETDQERFFALIKKRQQGEPIAYLTGHREFWSLDLLVTPAVLIPRPETELLVELTLQQVKDERACIADLGTGSGAIALALALERPSWTIFATDQSEAALEVAKQNAKRLNVGNISFHHGEWFHALPQKKFHAIVSNPPYIAEEDVHLSEGDLRFEPRKALIASEEGLKDLKEIILQGKNYLISQGVVILEHGFNQGKDVISIFRKAGYTDVSTYQDLAGLDRVTIASWIRF
jgi:release factor glutamine methyltransferase